MLCSKINAMAIGGVMWVSRSQEQTQLARHQMARSEVEGCPICGQPWTLMAQANNAETCNVLVVLSEPIADAAQQKLFENCLAAAGWTVPLNCFSLHAACASSQTSIDALEEYITEHQPELMIVFGSDAAQLLHPEFVLGQIYSFAHTPLIVTHHPKEMITNPMLKARVWADFCLIKGS